ncbi:MAG: DUF1449 family protein [Xenococcaceae cyanobacterium MO_188.B19]|nr:DUF1449 family protein [Xenococcaceae cyanobacterium MO_188.B19]
MLFSLANLSYWIFLSIGIVLFLLVIISGGGDDDIELEAELDADSDLDFESAGDGDGEFNSLQFLAWLGFGKAPLILLLAVDFSIWGVTGWILNVFVGNSIGEIPTRLFGLGGLILVTSFIISIILGSLIANPLGKIFASFGEDASSNRLVGCLGIVNSKSVPYEGNNQIAQADVLDPARNLVTIPICLPSWAKIIPQNGEEILIIEQTKNYYLAILSQGEDRNTWQNH